MQLGNGAFPGTRHRSSCRAISTTVSAIGHVPAFWLQHPGKPICRSWPCEPEGKALERGRRSFETRTVRRRMSLHVSGGAADIADCSGRWRLQLASSVRRYSRGRKTWDSPVFIAAHMAAKRMTALAAGFLCRNILKHSSRQNAQPPSAAPQYLTSEKTVIFILLVEYVNQLYRKAWPGMLPASSTPTVQASPDHSAGIQAFRFQLTIGSGATLASQQFHPDRFPTSIELRSLLAIKNASRSAGVWCWLGAQSNGRTL